MRPTRPVWPTRPKPWADEADDANDAVEAVEAVEAKVNEANNAIEAVEADEASVPNEASVVDKADASVADKADARVADEAELADIDESEKSDYANEVKEADEAESNEVGVSVELPLLLPFSLTKYSAIFAEVKGSFEIYNNQLGGLKGGCLSPCSLMIRFVCGIRDSIFKNI
jgi:hypothetical protein